MAANKDTKNPGGFNEFIRKTMVSLKRGPQVIPMVALVIALLVYSLRLKIISDTTARINIPGMGIAGFVTMLFSMLVFVAFMNAFPRHKKPIVPLLALVVIMQGIMIACDAFYLGKITEAITRADSPIVINEKTQYIKDAQGLLSAHVVILIIAIALIVLLPVYSAMLKKVNTSIDVAGNDNMGAIELSGDE